MHMEKRITGFHCVFVYLDLDLFSAGCIRKASYLNTGPKPDYVFLIEVFSVCISQAVRVVAMVVPSLSARGTSEVLKEPQTTSCTHT